jgi:hypothetical protein
VTRAAAPDVIWAVFRLGVVQVGPGYVAYHNRAASGRITLSPGQETRWRAWFARQHYAPVRHGPAPPSPSR